MTLNKINKSDTVCILYIVKSDCVCLYIVEVIAEYIHKNRFLIMLLLFYKGQNCAQRNNATVHFCVHQVLVANMIYIYITRNILGDEINDRKNTGKQ